MVKNQPRNVEEFAHNKSWMRKLRTTVSRYRMHDKSSSVEDVVQEVLHKMCKRDENGLDHIQRWDKSKGAFSTWVYLAVKNVCIHKYHRGMTKAGRALFGSLSIVAERNRGSTENISVGEVCLETAQGAPANHLDQDDGDLQTGSVFQDLAWDKPKSWVTYTSSGAEVFSKTGAPLRVIQKDVPPNLVGKTFHRDAKTVFNMLAEEYTPDEIAETLQVTRSFVYTKIMSLRENPTIQDWKKSVEMGL